MTDNEKSDRINLMTSRLLFAMVTAFAAALLFLFAAGALWELGITKPDNKLPWIRTAAQQCAAEAWAAREAERYR